MTVNNKTLESGDRVMVVDHTRSSRGTVIFQCNSPCPEDGLPVYRVQFDDGKYTEMCGSVLVRCAP